MQILQLIFANVQFRTVVLLFLFLTISLIEKSVYIIVCRNDEPGEKTALQGQIKHLKEKVNSLQNELNRAETDYKTKLEQQRKVRYKLSVDL